YYEVTGKEEYLRLAETFAKAVRENEITVIGCAGCKSEQFNHSVEKETEAVRDKTIMQETCVTVTWMRLQERLLLNTGDVGYAEAMETSALNALYGAVNLHKNKQFCKEERSLLPGVPFDSYSPLVAQPRGFGFGGYKKFAEGGYYGCCACIGAAGVALYPFASTMLTKDGAEVVFYHSGKIKLPFEEGEMLLDAQGTLSSGRMEYVVSAAPSKEKTITFRIPSWSGSTEVYLNGEEVKFEGSILSLCRRWQAGDKVTLVFGLSVKAHRLNGKAAFTYGPFALARDERKDKRFGKPLRLEKELVSFAIQKEEGEEVRLLLHTKKGEVLLTDYASCGKHWTEKKSHIALWSKEK
ncbi:MAG: glycoside hydrolase family 127 protein, partial [Clostridia bacterium]|nr:glycoside hydrolase family 127 protein [Clostridia bacterium]